MDTAQKLSDARTRLVFARPYVSDAAYALRPVLTTDVGALAVDERWRLYANPLWLATTDVGVVATGLLHEIQHLLLDHAGRARAVGVTAATHEIWNREAADPDINDGLVRDCRTCQPPLPQLPQQWCILPEHFGLPNDMTAEWYFAKRIEHASSSAGAGDTPENGGAGNGGAGRSGLGTGLGCGSGASGVPAPWDLGSPEESGVDGLDAAEAWDVRKRVAEAIAGFHDQKGRGSVPAGLVSWANDMLRPKPINWDRLLASAMRRSAQTTAGAVRLSYARTSRRMDAFKPVIMPAYRRPVPRVAFIADTSLSMDAHRALVRGVVEDACRRLGVPVRLLDTDAAVHRDVMVGSGRNVAWAGGGGTDMRAGIEQAMRPPWPCDTIVVCTDCATPWPEKRPGATVIVAAVGATEQSFEEVPAWATKIRVET